MKKKFLASIAAATALAISMGTAAFAATSETYTDEDDYDIPVTVSIESLEATVISVTVDWSDLEFEYTVKTAEWDSAKGEYKNVTGTWADGGKTTITATNDSNVPVTISGDFEVDDDLDGYDKIKVVVDTVTIPTLADDEDADNEDIDINVTISGDPTVNTDFEDVLGVITLTIEDASA